MKIHLQWVFAVKHDGRRKARCVARGDLTPDVKDTSYSGVVSLRSLRIVMLLGELNGLTSMAGDIGNAYLEAKTKEKVYIIAGQEFGDLAGCVMIIDKALYGLRTSGARFHDKLAETLRDLGFFPCKADPDVWMKDCETHYEYICCYVDDIMVCMKDPQAFFDTLQGEKYGYKLKGVGVPEYHLGGNFGRDNDGTLHWGSTRYIERMLENYERLFKSKPTKYSCPMEKGDSPELDTTPNLDKDGIAKYQSMIGALQWCVTLGRFDILVAVMSLSRFRAEPHQGHLDRVKRVYGYLRKYPHGKIRFRTGIPNHEAIFEVPDSDWLHSIYGERGEDYSDLPPPRGKPVRTPSFKDANLLHWKVTGIS